MNALTDREQELFALLENSASRLNILCAMLDLFEETEPFCVDDAYLSPAAQQEQRARSIRFLAGLRDLAGFYHRDMDAAVESCYRA